jgi:hypothetical protein
MSKIKFGQADGNIIYEAQEDYQADEFSLLTIE